MGCLFSWKFHLDLSREQRVLIGLRSAKAQIGELMAWLSLLHTGICWEDFAFSGLVFIFWHCEGVPWLTTMRDLQVGLHFAHGTWETLHGHCPIPDAGKAASLAPPRSSSMVPRLIQQPLGHSCSQAVRSLLQVHLLTLLGTRNTSLCGSLEG